MGLELELRPEVNYTLISHCSRKAEAGRAPGGGGHSAHALSCPEVAASSWHTLGLRGRGWRGWERSAGGPLTVQLCLSVGATLTGSDAWGSGDKTRLWCVCLPSSCAGPADLCRPRRGGGGFKMCPSVWQHPSHRGGPLSTSSPGSEPWPLGPLLAGARSHRTGSPSFVLPGGRERRRGVGMSAGRGLSA